MPLWKEALQLFFCGDQRLIDYVQQVCGLCLVGKVYQELDDCLRGRSQWQEYVLECHI